MNFFLLIIYLGSFYCCKAQNSPDNRVLLDLSYKDLSTEKVNRLLKKESRFKNIEELNLSGNKLDEIPQEIFDLKNLKILYLNNNLINSIPDEIKRLTNLKSLSLSGNRISFISSSISELKGLKTVMMRYGYTNVEIKEILANFCDKVKVIFYTDVPNPHGTKVCN